MPHPALQSNGTAFAVQNPRFGIKKEQPLLFIFWWRCGVCLTAIVTVGQSRAAEGVHVAEQRHGFCRAKSPLRNKKRNSIRCSFFGGDAGFVANIVCVITKRKCLHFKAECQPGYRGSRCKATARLLPCKIPASE